MQSTISKLLFLFAILQLAACASIKEASPAMDQKAKKFQPSPNASQVYVYRNESLGGALSKAILVDGQFAGTTGPQSYFHFTLPAGKHKFVSGVEGYDDKGKPEYTEESSLELQTENGKIYFIWQEIKMGFMIGGTELQVVDEATGRAGVLESRLIDSPVGR